MNPALTRRGLSTVAIIAATAAITSTVVSQAEPADDASHQAMMQAWMEAGIPGPEHERMAELAGSWTKQQTYWMYPGADAEHTTATSEIKSIFGGRLLVEKLRATYDMGGQKMEMEGLGIFGFDNIKRKHFFVWFSSHGTGMMYGEGEADHDADTITYYSEMPNPLTGEPIRYKTVSREISKDESELWMYEEHDGHWHKHMHMQATRN